MERGTGLVLITGAAGWLGVRLVKALLDGLSDCQAFREPAEGVRVRGLVLPTDETDALDVWAEGLERITGDLRGRADCARFCAGAEGATLLHTAGVIHPRRVRDFFDVNVRGTENVLDAATRAKVRRVVVVSSNSPIGCNPHPDHLFDEDSPYHPYMNYGKSKMQMELAVRRVQEEGNLETVVVRPPWFYGPNQPARQTLFFRMIRDGKAPIVGSGENRRSMAYIDNLCQGVLLAASTEAANGRTYWIADERPYTMHEIIDTIERLLELEFDQHCAHKRMRLPAIASEVALAADAAVQGIGLYHQKIHVLSEMNKTISCSIARAREELGYRPAIALEEGMRRSLRWCFEAGYLP